MFGSAPGWAESLVPRPIARPPSSGSSNPLTIFTSKKKYLVSCGMGCVVRTELLVLGNIIRDSSIIPSSLPMNFHKGGSNRSSLGSNTNYRIMLNMCEFK